MPSLCHSHVNRYAIFFYTAATVPQAVPGAIAALAATVVGLSAVTLSSDLEAIMLKGTTTTPYWIQIGLIAGYVASLFALYTNAPKPKSK